MIANLNTNKYDCVSFDIFDTLIKRCVPDPHDVFFLVERYCKENGISISENFKEKRIAAERAVNKNNRYPSTIQEIYEFFCLENGGNPVELEAVEKLIELDVCKPNLAIISLYRKCIQEGRRVFIISDMYMDSEFLKLLLKNCGITGYEKVFVSCEYQATKTTGELFKKVMAETGVVPEQWLHIGDNPKGDINSPQRIGIASYQLKSEKRYGHPIKAEISSKLDFAMSNRLIDIIGTSLNKSGYMGAKVLGPLLAGYSKWLSCQCELRDIHKVFFLSRDGYTMKEAFDIVNPNRFETEYIYASRRSWTVPAIWMEPEYDDILKNISMSPRTSVRSFVTRLGLLPENCLQEIQQCRMTVDTTINKKELQESMQFRQLYSAIREKVIDNSKSEYRALTKYLQEKNVKGKIAIVDIGYNGTMQKALKIILESVKVDVEIYGFYMGLNPNSKLLLKHEIEAFSFLYGPDKDNDYQNKINAFISVFESIFLAQHGSVYRFSLANASDMVELYDYEYDQKDAQYVDEKAIIKDFQWGAMEYVKFAASMLKDNVLQINNGIAINNLLFMGLRPEKNGVELFADFRMADTGINYIAHPNSIFQYLTNPRKIKKDFAASTWKIAFLYRLLRLPLPYEKIYYLMKKYIRS